MAVGHSTPELDVRVLYNPLMRAHECHHCKQWIQEGEAHDCWTTTEAALTQDLPDDLREAWERIRETAVEFGDQRIYASGTAIMFSRQTCYFFVRPRGTQGKADEENCPPAETSHSWSPSPGIRVRTASIVCRPGP